MGDDRSDVVSSRERVHLLHVGKTGGTALKAALEGHTTDGHAIVVLHGHRVTLRDVPAGDRFMFVVRDPVERFVSAFHSRRREGRPRFEIPWNDAERTAFARFATPQELAIGLRADDAETRRAAETAMRSIRHVCTSYWDWFESASYFRSRLDDLFFVARLDSLAADFDRLRTLLGLGPVTLPEDPVTAHRAPPGLDTRLDADARDALRRWYARDYAFVSLCDEVAPSARSRPGRR
jgi:hypothetical protein